MDAQDHELLEQFRTRGDESAFRQLVARHVGMVFAVAERVTANRPLAEEVAQSTFAQLAGKAETIGANVIVAGWLYHTARNLALAAARSEERRRQREQIAATMNSNEPDSGVVAQHLETAMDQLQTEDRDVLLLRYFEDRNLRDVGSELGVSEDAARMRVNRALEKLRGAFGRLGIAGSATWLVATLPTSAAAAVPAGLGATISTAVLSGTAIAATTAAIVTHTTSNAMNLFNLKTTAAILAVGAVTGTSTYLVKENEAAGLRAEQSSQSAMQSQLATDRREAMALVQLRDEQLERLKKDVVDIHRLRGEVDRLNREMEATKAVAKENGELRNQILGLQDQLRGLTEASRTTGVDGATPWDGVEVPERLFTKAYQLSFNFVQDEDTLPHGAENRALQYDRRLRSYLLKNEGISFKPPEMLHVGEDGKLFVRASLETLDLMDSITQKLNGSEESGGE